MLKKITLFMITFCAICNLQPMMKDDLLSLDDLELCAPHDWEPYLEKYSLNKIIKVIKKHNDYASMTDYRGNNLMLAFFNLGSKKYYDRYDYEKKNSLTKDTIKQFLDIKFDINFQNVKTKNNFLTLYVPYCEELKYSEIPYISSTLFEWIIHTYKPNVNLQNNNGETVLSKTINYPMMVLLLKYGGRYPVFYISSLDFFNRKHVELMTMFGMSSTVYTIVTPYDCLNTMLLYSKLINTKVFDINELETLIKTSKEGVMIFNRAAICNDTQILTYFINNGNDKEKILLKIIRHCCRWNRAGATLYALSELAPNRQIILDYTQKKNLLKKVLSYSLPKLERELIDIYNYACKEPKTGFRAWLFLEAFDKYLTFGNQKNIDKDTFIKYKNYDVNFKFL